MPTITNAGSQQKLLPIADYREMRAKEWERAARIDTGRWTYAEDSAFGPAEAQIAADCRAERNDPPKLIS